MTKHQQSSTAEAITINVLQEIPVQPNSINLRQFVGDDGLLYTVCDPSKIIQDAGPRQWTDRRGNTETTVKKGNTVSHNGKLWNMLQIGREWFQCGWMLTHLPNGPEQSRPAPVAMRPTRKLDLGL